MAKVKIVNAQWVDTVKAILCQVQGGEKVLNGRNIIVIEPEAFGIDSNNLNEDIENKLRKIASLLINKNINIEM